MRENSLDKQDFQSHQLELCCNENAIAMLNLSSQGSPEMMTHEADFCIFAKKNARKGGDAQKSIILNDGPDMIGPSTR
jgi:hypothetical protein